MGGDHGQAAETVQHPQALLELAHGEARHSLLTVHGILEATLPADELSIYEAGGGSTSFLPLKVLHRALNAGITSFDTAEGYGGGHSEEIVLSGEVRASLNGREIAHPEIESADDIESSSVGGRSLAITSSTCCARPR